MKSKDFITKKIVLKKARKTESDRINSEKQGVKYMLTIKIKK